ncbi:unnamed protein product [Moneuplotes crassus]|uniref:Uncharacterized protein n=1 Tax=Euplotes crassus TaxID=5936 RepID=A0AAD2D621_EUPCR|nr:unnamed protein product [Moneuplotes crassus]
MGIQNCLGSLVRIVLGAAFAYIGALKFLHLWEKSIPQANRFFEMTVGPRNDFVSEVYLRGFSALQLLAGFLIIINQSKTGAQLLALSILAFLATTYNPYINGFGYEQMTLFINEFSLIGICFMLYGYANHCENDSEPKECPMKHMVNKETNQESHKGGNSKKGKGKNKKGKGKSKTD